MENATPTDVTATEVTSAAGLRTIYREPSGPPVDKVIDRLDHHCVDFLARCPFFVLSTANADGVCDGSPKGGRPGFVHVLDDTHVAFADLSGNNRLDSFENVVTNPSVAMLCMIPGLDETLRINGRAVVSTDGDLRERVAIDGRAPKVVVVVEVDEAYVHCAKAFRRSELWDPDSWSDPDDLPDGRCMVRDHAQIDIDLDLLQKVYDDDVESTMWEPGGGR